MVALSDINASAYEYLMSVMPQFNSICEPLSKLGISYFGYIKIFQDGSYLVLNDYHQLAKSVLQESKKFDRIFVTEIEKIQNDKTYYFLWPTDIKKINKKENFNMHIHYSFNVWNIFSILKPSNQEFIESYHFAMRYNEGLDAGFYLNNIPLLECFIDYFNERSRDLTDVSDKRKLAYFAQEFQFYKPSEEDVLAEKIQQFLKETLLQSRIIRGKDKQVKLTQREIECLQYLALGYSIKGIGKLLDLSPRTIEFYMHNARKRTGYLTKSQLLTSFIESATWELYPIISK